MILISLAKLTEEVPGMVRSGWLENPRTPGATNRHHRPRRRPRLIMATASLSQNGYGLVLVVVVAVVVVVVVVAS